MISTDATQRRQRPLYIFAKPPVAKLSELRRLRASLAIESRYSLDRVHCTFLMLGESEDARIDAARDALAAFHAEPFEVAFDHIDGATLKPRKGLRGPGLFRRALARHFVRSGLALPDYSFGLHLNLDYPPASDRRATIPPLGWIVEEILLVESSYGNHILHGQRRLAARQYALAL
jgi:hypothetical protein